MMNQADLKMLGLLVEHLTIRPTWRSLCLFFGLGGYNMDWMDPNLYLDQIFHPYHLWEDTLAKYSFLMTLVQVDQQDWGYPLRIHFPQARSHDGRHGKRQCHCHLLDLHSLVQYQPE